MLHFWSSFQKRGVEDFTCLRPLSLVSNLSKLLVKVLTDLLWRVVGKVVSCF